jgi:hypothetical protein
MGLVALVVTLSVFLWKTSHRYIGICAVAAMMVIGVMLAGRQMRLSVPEVAGEAARRGEIAEHVLSAPPTALLLGVGSTRRLAISPIPEQDASWISTSMHLTLIRQNGIIGWALMLWIFGAVLLALYRGYHRIHDPHMRRIVWAIFSSLVGFLISMTDANVFFNVTIQIYVWGMIGVGIGILTHLSGRRPTFHVLWRFGEHGD